MTSGFKWEGEEGGDEDVEQEEELGGGNFNYYYFKLFFQIHWSLFLIKISYKRFRSVSTIKNTKVW